ncbi:hypothetical protein G6F59_017813 [Rhizopus arrhizus]|nr:hypothetical protein G6F59_017813 [Rhizopus arrhizus]
MTALVNISARDTLPNRLAASDAHSSAAAPQAMARKARICRVGATGTALWPRRINHRMAASATAVSATVDSR